MFNNKLMKIVGACILLFILSFGLISSVCADNSVNNGNKNNFKDSTVVKTLTLVDDYDSGDYDDFGMDYDDLDDYDSGDYDDFGMDYDDYDLDDYDLDEEDDSDDDLGGYDLDEEDDFDEYDLNDDYCVYCGGKCDNCDYCLSYREFEWKGNSYTIDLNQFNLTDEELIELFTKRDVLMEEIKNLESMIETMELSRNNDILLAIDELYEVMNKITNNTEFNDLLLSLKDINITEVNSVFNELKRLLESIKAEHPDEDFAEIDYLMDNIETLLNEELERYENLTSELAELFEFFDKYPFLRENNDFTIVDYDIYYAGGYTESERGYRNFNKVSSGMKNTGIPYFSLAILILIIVGLFGVDIKRKF